jgi:predicted nucleotidyltransferase
MNETHPLSMIPIINKHRADLVEICRRYGVNRLYIFGSAAQDRFDPDRSDLDSLVEIAGREPSGSYADRYLDLADALERLFGRRVDLVTEQSIRNPYFRREVEATRQLIYEYPRQDTVV